MFGRKLSCTYFLPSKVPADILHCGRLLHSKSSSESTSSFFTIKHGCLNFDTCKVGIYFTNSNFVIAVAFLAKNASSRHPAHWLKYAQCIGMVASSLTILPPCRTFALLLKSNYLHPLPYLIEMPMSNKQAKQLLTTRLSLRCWKSNQNAAKSEFDVASNAGPI